jgi:hypothetical protein
MIFFFPDRIVMRLQIFPQMKVIINKNKKQNKKWFRVGVVGHRQFLGWFEPPPLANYWDGRTTPHNRLLLVVRPPP